MAINTLNGYSLNQENGYIAIWHCDQIRHHDDLSVSVMRLSQILYFDLLSTRVYSANVIEVA